MVTLEVFALALALSAPNDAVLLEFSATWCGPCRSMQPTVERLTRDGYSVKQIDVDQRPDLAKQYRISGLPTFVMVAGGREVDRIVGPCDYQRLQQLFPARATRDKALLVPCGLNRRMEGRPVKRGLRAQIRERWPFVQPYESASMIRAASRSAPVRLSMLMGAKR